ncbi:MAG: 6-phosphogluconolactonase [Asticcacaulis sp.]
MTDPVILEGDAGRFEVQVFATPYEAETAVLNLITEAVTAAIVADDKAVICGAGGSTPKPVYERLKTLDVAWDKVTLTQVDERFVEVDDPSSNTRMMREAVADIASLSFLSLIQDSDQALSAQKAEAQLRSLNAGEPPVFDITLLGMGGDKHYASIFPQHPLNADIYETDAIVVPVTATDGSIEPKLPRLTLSVSALNRSRRIVLYITGEAKLEALRQAIATPDKTTAPIGAFLKQYPHPVDIVWVA